MWERTTFPQMRLEQTGETHRKKMNWDPFFITYNKAIRDKT